jgi:hypothetical protein
MARDGYINAELLRLPPEERLKGKKDFADWRDKMMTIAIASGLHRHIRQDPTKPKEIMHNNNNATKEQERAWAEWKTRDANMKRALYENTTAAPMEVIQFEDTALDCWTVLEARYGTNGPEAEYRVINELIDIKYENYRSLEDFIAAFKRATERIDSLGLAPPEAWQSSMFIHALSKAHPTWAGRQLRESRGLGKLRLLNDLMADIMREKESHYSSGTSISSPMEDEGGSG